MQGELLPHRICVHEGGDSVLHSRDPLRRNKLTDDRQTTVSGSRDACNDGRVAHLLGPTTVEMWSTQRWWCIFETRVWTSIPRWYACEACCLAAKVLMLCSLAPCVDRANGGKSSGFLVNGPFRDFISFIDPDAYFQVSTLQSCDLCGMYCSFTF